MSTSRVTNVTLELIKKITGDFSEKKRIGSGGYGEVFKGVLNGDEIAIKKLFPVHGLDDEAFDNEFRNLMKVEHKNVVQLIGYCYEISHRHTEYNGQLVFAKVIDRALCFEYMQGGSLVKHISAESCIHDWPTTYKIIKGTCEGLHYLHKGRGEKNYIYHLDLKPDNVLLDKNMVPKIGDFGLSRLFGESKTHQTSTTRGTIGFMPPEFINNRMMSAKNDVFSLGVIIFYIMAGEKGYNDYCDLRLRPESLDKSRQEFVESVQMYWKKKMQATAAYTWHEADLLGVTKCMEIAMSCVDTDRAKRPTTEEFIGDLNKLEAEIEKMSKKITKSVVGQDNWDFKKDIAVDPPMELRFAFEPKRDISCCVQLTNKADTAIAFNIKTDQTKYRVRPDKGTMPPCSKRYIVLTLRAQEEAPPNMQCLDMAIVQSTRVAQGLTSQEEITQLFLKDGDGVAAMDEVTLPIVYVALDQSALSE